MVSAARHNELVDFILNEDRDLGGDDLLTYVGKHFGEFTFAEIDKAMEDAADREREEALELEAEAAYLEKFRPLAEGVENKDVPIYDIAKIKAAAGDKLAQEFVDWCNQKDDGING